MQLPNRQRFAVALMAFSLGLLLLFLGLFVRKVYLDELDTLKRESSLLFVNAVRGIEGELFDQLIVRGEPGNMQLPDFPRRPPVLRHHDSLEVFTYIQKRTKETGTVRRDTQLRIQLARGEPLTGNPDMRGALSVIVAMSDERVLKDSMPNGAADTNCIFHLLERNFTQSVRNAGLPVHFRLLRLPEDSLLQRREFIAGSYTDLANGERYGAALGDFQPYLWRKLLPQVFFALFLFTCVGLAFWFVFQTLRQQQQLAEQKNDFVRNMTHELKTPIATVSVAIEALQNFDALQDRARTAEYLHISRLELARLSLLVDSVLRLSLFEKNEQVFQFEPLNLKTLVEHVLQSMQLQFGQAAAQVDFSSTGSDFTLRGDALHLTSVVYNLLDNALKYSPGEPKISVALAQQDGTVTLRVKDQGQGIPAVYQQQIFERFFRVPTGNVHNVKGHGLGLSYVAGVVQQHRGQILVDSTGEAGTCFTVTLPQV